MAAVGCVKDNSKTPRHVKIPLGYPAPMKERRKDMNYTEAIEWLKGKRSMTNLIPQHPIETWEVRIAEADAAKAQEAYWIVKAEQELML